MTTSTLRAAEPRRTVATGRTPGGKSIGRADAGAPPTGMAPASYTVSSGADLLPRLGLIRAWWRRVTRIAA
jgi:hypothetical protein